MPKIPKIKSPFIPVYCPAGDYFPGPDSKHFVAGKWYPEWVPNDHTIIKGPTGCWHAFGITHPTPLGDAYIHEGEWMAFHAVAPKGNLKDNLSEGKWKDEQKVLVPKERMGERKELYAPFVVNKDGLYYMFYGPKEIRVAVSENLYNWKPQGTVFQGGNMVRDPCVIYNKCEYYMVYIAGKSLYLRKSKDLLNWSDKVVEIFRIQRKGVPESPVLVKYEDWFYLFWCIYDGENGMYDNRTFVFSSKNPFDFKGAEQVTAFRSHAPEIFQDEEGQWFISSVEWPYRGVSIASLIWE